MNLLVVGAFSRVYELVVMYIFNYVEAGYVLIVLRILLMFHFKLIKSTLVKRTTLVRYCTGKARKCSHLPFVLLR